MSDDRGNSQRRLPPTKWTSFDRECAKKYPLGFFGFVRSNWLLVPLMSAWILLCGVAMFGVAYALTRKPFVPSKSGVVGFGVVALLAFYGGMLLIHSQTSQWLIRRTRRELRRRGAPICVTCGYDMQRLKMGLCPECGGTSGYIQVACVPRDWFHATLYPELARCQLGRPTLREWHFLTSRRVVRDRRIAVIVPILMIVAVTVWSAIDPLNQFLQYLLFLSFFAAAGVYGAIWVLLRRRLIREEIRSAMSHRFKEACVQCEHHLADATEGECPECGHPFGPMAKQPLAG